MFDYDASFPGYNLFVYCGNEPILRIDCSGADSAKIDDLDIADDQIENVDGGQGFFGGVSGSSWATFTSTMRSAASGLNMAVGAHNGFQTHHMLSNVNKTYTPQYKEVTDKYYLELDQNWNKVDLSHHRGRHTKVYHEFMLTMLREVDSVAKGDLDLFMEGFRIIAEFLVENDWIPYAR